MSSPVRQINVECPKCHVPFTTPHRASMNLQLDDFDEDYIESMSTAACPACKHKFSLDSLIVEKDGVWNVVPAKRYRCTQITGNVGLYYVCYQLSIRGWNAMPTSRNAKGIDIVAYNHDCTRRVFLQVKTLSKSNPVPLGLSVENLMGDYWVIANNVETTPCVYVMTPREVRERAFRGIKNGKTSYWLQPKQYETEEFREKWDRLTS